LSPAGWQGKNAVVDIKFGADSSLDALAGAGVLVCFGHAD